MDENAYDQLLREKFSRLTTPPETGDFVNAVMTRLAQMPESEDPAPRHYAAVEQKPDDWVLGFAVLLGMLVCVPSLWSLDMAGWYTQLLSLDLNTAVSAWSPWSVAVLLFGLLFPMGLWLLDD